jgi:uncharacterized protein (UPF0332 family)
LTQETKTIISYRRQKAQEALSDALLLLENKRLRAAVNRIYYAIFYEVMALLLTRKLFAAKHMGVRALFNQHFVKTGNVPGNLGSFYSKMFEFRQEGDYEDKQSFQEDQVKQWYYQAKEFIVQLDKVIDDEIKKAGN